MKAEAFSSQHKAALQATTDSPWLAIWLAIFFPNNWIQVHKITFVFFRSD